MRPDSGETAQRSGGDFPVAVGFWAGIAAAVFCRDAAESPAVWKRAGFRARVSAGRFGRDACRVACLAGGTAGRSRSGGMASTLALVSPQSVGLLVAVAPLVWMRANLLDTLLGVAIGWFCSSLPLLIGNSSEEAESGLDALPLTAGIGFVATLCALFALGEMRAPAALFHSPQRAS